MSKKKYIYYPPILDYAQYREELASIKRAERLAAQELEQEKKKGLYETAHNKKHK